MPPPVPHTLKRMTAQPSRPVQRYRPGKPTQDETSSEEDDDEEKVEQQKQTRQQRTQRTAPTRPSQPTSKTQDIEDSDEEGFVTEEEDAPGTGKGGVVIPVQVKPTQTIQSGARTVSQTRSSDGSDAASSEEESDEDDGSEDEDEDESSSSDEEARKKRFVRPTFVKKSDRADSKPAPATTTKSETDTTNTNTILQTTSALTTTDQARRLDDAEQMIKDKLERDALARAQGRKAWDDDDELAPEDKVDDRDGLDPSAEHAAWRLRELKRLKRDREQIETREKEIEEIERRRNLTVEEREREDREYLDRQRLEKEENRSGAAYLAKYHHKGAFFQDDETAQFLKQRDVMGAKFVDDVDKSTLPEYMKIRDMTKLGKKGRTRYTDLKGEDTGRFGNEVKRWRGANVAGIDRDGGGNNFDSYRNIDERFQPDTPHSKFSNDGPTGANASILGQKRDRYDDKARDRSKDRQRSRNDDREDRYRPRSRSRSTSKSPRRRRRRSRSRDDDHHSHKVRRRSYSRSRSRSRSPQRERDRDKRRRIET